MAQFLLQVRENPWGGECDVISDAVEAWSDYITVECTGWQHADHPLSYSFHLETDKRDVLLLHTSYFLDTQFSFPAIPGSWSVIVNIKSASGSEVSYTAGNSSISKPNWVKAISQSDVARVLLGEESQTGHYGFLDAVNDGNVNEALQLTSYAEWILPDKADGTCVNLRACPSLTNVSRSISVDKQTTSTTD